MRQLAWFCLLSAAFAQSFPSPGPNSPYPHSGVTPVAFNNTNTVQTLSSGSASVSLSVTAGGTHTVAFLWIEWDSSTITVNGSPTYNSVSMTSCGTPSQNSTNGTSAQCFYLANPATGSNTLAFTMSSNTSGHFNLVSFNNVNQSTPIRSGTYQESTGTGTTNTFTITSNTSDLTMGIFGTNKAANINSTNQTSDGFTNSGSIGSGSDHATTAASSITDTWTYSASDQYCFIGFSIQAG